LDEHRHHGRHQPLRGRLRLHPLPAPLSGVFVAIGMPVGAPVSSTQATGCARAVSSASVSGWSKAALNRWRIVAIAPRLISIPRS
jgi:hypothetical protein